MEDHYRIAPRPCPFCHDIWLYASVGDYASDYESKGFKLECKCGYAWRNSKWRPTREATIYDWNDMVNKFYQDRRDYGKVF